jgi:hypothetical protein
MSKNLYRYTTNGEGTFSAGRRLIDSLSADLKAEVLSVVAKNKSWLTLPALSMDNLEFYWTELGRQKYEESFLVVHQKYLPNIQFIVTTYEQLSGPIVYEDIYQVGISSSTDKSLLPNPYKK